MQPPLSPSPPGVPADSAHTSDHEEPHRAVDDTHATTDSPSAAPELLPATEGGEKHAVEVSSTETDATPINAASDEPLQLDGWNPLTTPPATEQTESPDVGPEAGQAQSRPGAPPGVQRAPAASLTSPPQSPGDIASAVSRDAPSPRAARKAPTRRPILSGIALVGMITLASVLFALLGYVARGLAPTDGSVFALFTLDGLRYWLPGLVLALLTGGSVLLIAGRRTSPGLSPATAWMFPFSAMLAGLLLVSVYHDRPWWFVAPIVTWCALLVGAIARTFLSEPSGGARDVARTTLTIITYVVAFLALAMIYINKLRSIFSATAVVVVCVLLLLQISDGEPASFPRRFVYAIAGGLIIGQVTWVINYWSAAGWTGGAFLLAVFYLIAGLSAAQLRDRIGLFDVLEFGGVALVALAIVSAAVLYQSQ